MNTQDIAVEVQKMLRRAARFDRFLEDLQTLIDRYQNPKIGKPARRKAKKKVKRRPNLTHEEVRSIRAQAKAGLTTKVIAKNFNIHQTTTNSIIKGRLHRNVQ